ncbi:MAG: Gfo/Idh/MocA family protein [Roseiflexaceae bacterium]|jgi:predicted dehydrogenase|nr:Gfo/Idh/MocA family oxidoreductase [Chloroflexaceae bacterium]
MRVGMIGIGGIADVYRKALKEYQQPVRAVCDINATRVQEVAAAEQCQGYTDYREMLAKESLDAVFVSIPPGAHRDHVIDVVNAGSAVFVAKPIGLDIQLVERTLAAITKAGVINQVGYMSRYSDMASKARELIGDRKVVMGLGRFMVRMGANHPWWGKRAICGGQIVEQSTHQFDFLRYVMGEVSEVHAYGHKGAGDDIADFEDSTIVTLHFANGGIGTVVSTSCTDVPDGCGWEFTGRDLYLRMIMDVNLSGVIDGQPVSYTGIETGYIRQVGEFLTAVKSKNQQLVRSAYADAVKSLKVTLAAEQALQTGRPVRL